MSFWRAVGETFRAVRSDRSVFSTLVLAVVLYGFFYPAAYYGQVAIQMSVVVVDLDNTALSRRILQNAAAVRAVHIVRQSSSFNEARAMLRDRQADAILLIPDGLEASALRGKESGIALYLSGAYLARTKELGAGLGGAIAAALKETLKPLADAVGIQPGIQLDQRPMYNNLSGYGSYVVPAVAALIAQQTLLLGVSMLICRQRESSRRRVSPSVFFGQVFCFVLIGCLSCLYFFGFVFWLQDYPRAGNLAGMLATVPVFVAANVMLAMLLGSLFDRAERPAQVLTFTSVPFFFLTGASWPLSAMPVPMAVAAWAVPSTAGVRTFVKLNQMGATLAEVSMEWLVLLALVLVFGGLAYVRLVQRSLSGVRPPAFPDKPARAPR